MSGAGYTAQSLCLLCACFVLCRTDWAVRLLRGVESTGRVITGVIADRVVCRLAGRGKSGTLALAAESGVEYDGLLVEFLHVAVLAVEWEVGVRCFECLHSSFSIVGPMVVWFN